MIRVVNIKTTRAKNPQKVSRPTVLGNIFTQTHGTRAKRIAAYRMWLWNQIKVKNPAVLAELTRLKNLALEGDLNLACFCAPKACHAEVIKSCITWCINKSK